MFIVTILLTFSSEETVIEVQPANDSANIERATDRVQLVVRSRNLGAYVQQFSILISYDERRRTIRHNSAFYNRSKKLGTLWEVQTL